jgi:hypothetical protein
VINRPLEEKLSSRDWRPVWLIENHDRTFKSNRKAILAGDNDHRVSNIFHDEDKT